MSYEEDDSETPTHALTRIVRTNKCTMCGVAFEPVDMLEEHNRQTHGNTLNELKT